MFQTSWKNLGGNTKFLAFQTTQAVYPVWFIVPIRWQKVALQRILPARWGVKELSLEGIKERQRVSFSCSDGELGVSGYWEEGKGKGQPLSHHLLGKSHGIAPCPRIRCLQTHQACFLCVSCRKNRSLESSYFLWGEGVSQNLMYLIEFQAYLSFISGRKKSSTKARISI